MEKERMEAEAISEAASKKDRTFRPPVEPTESTE